MISWQKLFLLQWTFLPEKLRRNYTTTGWCLTHLLQSGYFLWYLVAPSHLFCVKNKKNPRKTLEQIAPQLASCMTFIAVWMLMRSTRPKSLKKQNGCTCPNAERIQPNRMPQPSLILKHADWCSLHAAWLNINRADKLCNGSWLRSEIPTFLYL